MTRKLPIGLAAALALIFCAPAMAREKTSDGLECLYAPQTQISTLREPQFETARISWSAIYVQDGMDVFSDMVLADDGGLVAAGVYTKNKDDNVYKPLLVKYDDKMKVAWEMRGEPALRQTIDRILKTKDGYTVIGGIEDKVRGNGIYIASFDQTGKVRGSPVSYFEAGGNLEAKAFIPAQDGGGYVVAAQFIDKSDPEKQHGLLYKISNDGAQIWKRSFKTGRSTVFKDIRTAQDGNYIITGQMVLDGNRSAAWLLVADHHGAIKWQRYYPRGTAASFEAAGQNKQGEFFLVGKARPASMGEQTLSGWVMKTDAAGNPLWQRYLQGPYAYEAMDVIVYEDGRSSVLMAAEGLSGDLRSHTRLVTFSPQGESLHMEDITDGRNAVSRRLVAGPMGERIVVGYSQTSFGDDQASNELAAAPDYTFDGWLAAAAPLDAYDDPCEKGQNLSPILR